MNDIKKTSTLLKKYLRWPAVVILILLGATVSLYFVSPRAALVMLIWTLFGAAVVLVIYFSFKGRITKALVGFAKSTGEKENKLAMELDVPYALLSENGEIAWYNELFGEMVEAALEKEDASSRGTVRNIGDLIPDIDEMYLIKTAKTGELHCGYGEREYRVIIKRVSISGDTVFAVYFYDETEHNFVKKKAFDDTQVVGLVYLDNFEEVKDSVDESKKSLLLALVDRKVTNYFSRLEGILKKLESDKYIFVIKRKFLPLLEEERFSLLDEVKTVNVGNTITVTCSIGVGLDTDSFALDYANARAAIDMALGRGGDQAVVKQGSAVRYFGGKSQSIEKATRVKARVKAQAFSELLQGKDRLIIMGHKIPDIDCVGAAVGIWRIAKTLGKEANIIVGDYAPSIKQLTESFEASEYPSDMFIGPKRARELMDENTMLAVVDVNRPVITEEASLIDAADTVVVIDHHRQTTDSIAKAVLSYIEPYASSACEMVAEIIQYIEQTVTLKPAEANAMYAGIVIDTNNFTNQAGVRTFEAAAYLRKCGADITKVRKAFRDSVADYKVKAEAIHNADIYRGSFAIGTCKGGGLTTPTVVGARAANDLLDIEGIKASIVMTEYNGKIFLSARSIDEVNVQVLMEALGGGGHRSIAGAQLEGDTIESAGLKVKAVIDEMIARGDVK